MLQESIYNIVPQAKKLQEKDARYKSNYPHWIVPTGTTFNLGNCSYPNVANLNGEYDFPRGAHPVIRSSATFGLPEGAYKPDPQNFHKKGETYKILPPLERLHMSTEVRRPPVPTVREKPIMGLKTEKNYIISNCVDNILMEPKKLPEETKDIYRHKSYGKVPNYISNYKLKAEHEFETIREIKRKRKEEEDKKQRLLSDSELNSLREGLKKKWEIYNRRYAKLTHKKMYDNLVLLRKYD